MTDIQYTSMKKSSYLRDITCCLKHKIYIFGLSQSINLTIRTIEDG